MRNKASVIVCSALMVVLGCESVRKKPFVITGKNPVESGYSVYYYQDGCGVMDSFTDNSGKYSVGDTIK